MSSPKRKGRPLSMSRLIHDIHGVISKTTKNAQEMKDRTKKFTDERDLDIPHVDLKIQFIGASGLPKMDVVGSADPYFIADLDHKISLVSTVVPNNLSPVWNEMWLVRNVPWDADLHVEVLDKDNSARDDYIGKFKTSITAGTKEVEIEGLITHRKKGTFWLKIESEKSSDPNAKINQYIFDGPIRFSRHFSPTVGLFTNIDDVRLYSTWKIYLRGVRMFFADRVQHWNKDYKAAQSIFQGPTSIAVRSGIQAGHKLLYARSTRNDFGVISTKEDVVRILHGEVSSSARNQESGVDGEEGTGSQHPPEEAGPSPNGGHSSRDRKQSPWSHRVKPAVYTYIISSEDDSFRFSETGAAFFVDFASKHALHSNCSTTVRYSGEFHPRPKGGWADFQDSPDEETEWELVIDNNSGTYSPDPEGLKDLKALLEYNFPGFTIVTKRFEDEELKASVAACRKYAVERRGVTEDQLEPHVHEGETTLLKQASLTAGQVVHSAIGKGSEHNTVSG